MKAQHRLALCGQELLIQRLPRLGYITGNNFMRKRYVLLGIVGGAAALISQLPLSWVAPHFLSNEMGQDVGYSGTVWDGQVNGLNFIGTADFKFSLRKLIGEGLPLRFVSRSPAMTISGMASPKALKDIRFSGTLAKLPTRDGRLKELAGNVTINLDELQIQEEKCASAQGKISTDFLALNQSRWQWKGPVIAGPISCEGGDLLVNLSGQENRQIIRADLRLSPNGSYSANVSVQTDQVEAGVVLPLYGFEKQGREYKLTEQGQWR
jgi:hypothetical protein